MRIARRRRLLRTLAVILLVWLGGDALAHGSCSHDLISFVTASSELGTAGSNHSSPDRDDVNHCSCHWQFLPAAPPPPVVLSVLAPVAVAPCAGAPPVVEHTLFRPPLAAA